MAAIADPLNLVERNAEIRANPSGEIHSLIDPTQTLSYDRLRKQIFLITSSTQTLPLKPTDKPYKKGRELIWQLA